MHGFGYIFLSSNVARALYSVMSSYQQRTCNVVKCVAVPCYPVPSSRILPLATAVVAPLHPALSLASRRMLLMVAPFEYPSSVSTHICLGLPLFLDPFILPSITSSSIPPALITCPKKLNAAFGTLDSSVHSGLMFSMIHMKSVFQMGLIHICNYLYWPLVLQTELATGLYLLCH